MRGAYRASIALGGFETGLGDVGGAGTTITVDVMGV